jgi:hypothetical protein
VSKYLEEMNSRYLSFLTELKSTLGKLEVEHIKFSKMIYAVENQRIMTVITLLTTCNLLILLKAIQT